MFSENTKIACVYPLDKHTDDRHSVTNFRPVSVLDLSTFLKLMKQL